MNTTDAVRATLARLDFEATIAAEAALLQALGAHPDFEPSPEDYKELDDWLERIDYEDRMREGRLPL